MTTLDMILETIGFAVVAWWLLGFTWFLFGMDVQIPPKPWHPPLSAKFGAAFSAGFSVPWLAITMGGLPKGVTMLPDFKDQADAEAFKKWQQSVCKCDACRARRGEK